MARLSSAEFDPTPPDSPMCLRFWTHMYGSGVGTLSIQLADTREEGHEQVLWTLSGESGNAWYQAQVAVSSANPFRVSDVITITKGADVIALGGRGGQRGDVRGRRTANNE